MTKRKRSDEEELQPPSKKLRSDFSTQLDLGQLSDELVLKILIHLPVSELAIVQRCVLLAHTFRLANTRRVCRRLQWLSTDSELWKRKYYLRWVRPRALRIPGVKDAESSSALLYSSKLAKWLDHSHLIQGGRETDWKRQYRLRYNWWYGRLRLAQHGHVGLTFLLGEGAAEFKNLRSHSHRHLRYLSNSTTVSSILWIRNMAFGRGLRSRNHTC